MIDWRNPPEFRDPVLVRVEREARRQLDALVASGAILPGATVRAVRLAPHGVITLDYTAVVNTPMHEITISGKVDG